jgi:hypothetical protein
MTTRRCPLPTIPQVAQALQTVFGPVATDAARRTGFVRRQSNRYSDIRT